MSFRPALLRLGAPAAAVGALTLAVAAPASAHVGVTPTDSAAGASSTLTFSVGHGCEGSPTTSLEIQLPEEILSATPTRHPFWDSEITMEPLDEPVTDAHGNEVTERVATVRWSATEPLPDGVRDTVQLSVTVPDAEGEWLWFPTIQTCEQGETAWTQVAEDGEDAHDLESPAPGFEVGAAAGDAHGHSDADADAEESSHSDEETAGSDDASGEESDAEAGSEPESASESGEMLGWAGLGAGLLGLAAGGTALARSRKSS